MELSGASRHGSLSIALRSRDDSPRTRRGLVTMARQAHDTVIAKKFEQRPAFFVFKISGGTFPVEKFAEGFRQLRQMVVQINCRDIFAQPLRNAQHFEA